MILSPANPGWCSEFSALRDVYSTELGELIVGIEHVGSTAVPGLMAKPILDIDLVIPDCAAFPAIVAALDRLGYAHRGDQGIFQREVFAPRPGVAAPVVVPERQWRQHHLYVCPAGGAELHSHLRFRDTLRIRTDLRREYEKIKRGIETRSGGDRKTYARIKETECSEFVERVLGAASLSQLPRYEAVRPPHDSCSSEEEKIWRHLKKST